MIFIPVPSFGGPHKSSFSPSIFVEVLLRRLLEEVSLNPGWKNAE